MGELLRSDSGRLVRGSARSMPVRGGAWLHDTLKEAGHWEIVATVPEQPGTELSLAIYGAYAGETSEWRYSRAFNDTFGWTHVFKDFFIPWSTRTARYSPDRVFIETSPGSGIEMGYGWTIYCNYGLWGILTTGSSELVGRQIPVRFELRSPDGVNRRTVLPSRYKSAPGRVIADFMPVRFTRPLTVRWASGDDSSREMLGQWSQTAYGGVRPDGSAIWRASLAIGASEY